MAILSLWIFNKILARTGTYGSVSRFYTNQTLATLLLESNLWKTRKLRRERESPEDADDVVPEALADGAVDDEVDGGVEDEEEVVEGDEHEEDRGQVVAPHVGAVQVVVLGLHVRPERLKGGSVKNVTYSYS